MTSRPFYLGLTLAGCWLCSAATAQVTVRELEFETAAGTARGLAAEIDLADPRIQVRVGAARVSSAQAEGFELVDTRTWAEERSVAIAINANFFGSSADGSAQIVGLCVEDGEELSAERQFEGRADPVLMFLGNGSAVISAGRGEIDANDITHAVAGVGGSGTSEVAGTLLVLDGMNLGASARVQPTVRHPRTAAGVSADGETLFLVVIDGRQADWSVGVTLPELASLLIEMGADDALNLDGGGSSAFVSSIDGELNMNRPSDGGFRPVAVSLGIEVRERIEREPVERAG